MSRLRPARRSMASPEPAPPRLAWHGELSDHVIDLRPSADGQVVGAATVSGAIRLLDAQSGALRHAVAGHPDGVNSIDWSPRAPVLASGGHDGRVRLWAGSTGEEIACLEAGRSWVERVRWSPDGSHLAAACGRRVVIWDDEGRLVTEGADHASTISDIAWSPEGSILGAACYGGVTLWSLANPAPLRLEWPGSSLSLAWSPDGRALATGHQDATVHFWLIEDGSDLEMSGYRTKVRELAWDPTGRFLATGGGPDVTVWDCRQPGPAHSRPTSLAGDRSRVSALAAQGTGSLMVAGSEDGGLTVFDAAGSVARSRFSFREEISVLAWHPDAQHVLVGTSAGVVACLAIG